MYYDGVAPAVTRIFLLVLTLAACTGPEQTLAPDGPMSEVDGPADFGAPCQVVTDMSTECSTGACVHFNMFPSPGLCTMKCTMSSQCPNGSMGPKCNTMGYCRP
jgi:hypothetical protein